MQKRIWMACFENGAIPRETVAGRAPAHSSIGSTCAYIYIDIDIGLRNAYAYDVQQETVKGTGEGKCAYQVGTMYDDLALQLHSEYRCRT